MWVTVTIRGRHQLAASFISNQECDVADWQKAGMPAALANVCSLGQCRFNTFAVQNIR